MVRTTRVVRGVSKANKIEQGKQIWRAVKKTYNEDSLPEIKVSYQPVLSRPLYYPDNDFAIGLSILIKRKTFTKDEIDHLRAMGFKVEVGVRQVELPPEMM